MKRAFNMKWKAFSITFKGLSIVRDCLRLESGLLVVWLLGWKIVYRVYYTRYQILIYLSLIKISRKHAILQRYHCYIWLQLIFFVWFKSQDHLIKFRYFQRNIILVRNSLLRKRRINFLRYGSGRWMKKILILSIKNLLLMVLWHISTVY